MLGAIAGDIIGSIYEAAPIKTKDFPLFGRGATFTDDTVCTIAVAEALLDQADFAARLRAWVQRHPGRGYGGMFLQWARDPDMAAYGSWGNGAAMRVAAIAPLAESEAHALALAADSASVSHDHADAVAGAQAVVLATWLARAGREARTISATLEARFGYDLRGPVERIRQGYGFDVSCRGTVPPALVAALQADGYEDAIRNAISLGGDSDTLACIAGGVAEALYGLPADIAWEARGRLTTDLVAVIDRFDAAAAPAGR